MKTEVITEHAFSKLGQLSVNAACIRAAMAYWTIPAMDLPPEFLSGIQKSGGFLCCDIHNPTSIDSLASLKMAGVDVCLHLVSTTGKSEIADSTGMPNHLLHSKVLIFDYENRESVVWVGSHNGTFRALDGINYECALAVHTNPSSELYQEVQAHLNEIRAACQSFNIDLIEHYRYLQGGKLENAVSVMEFENGNDQPLSSGEELSVFNMSREDLRSFKTVDTGVYVSLHGTDEILYLARVVQTGETPSAANQSFGVRRYADRHLPQLPVLLGATQVTKSMYKSRTYYAVVKIVSRLPAGDHMLEIPTQSAWVNMPAAELSKFPRLDFDRISASERRFTQPRGLKFKVPAFEEMTKLSSFDAEEVHELRAHGFKEMMLSEKRQISRPALIKKKLLVKR